jgi:hypothetical protein
MAEVCLAMPGGTYGVWGEDGAVNLTAFDGFESTGLRMTPEEARDLSAALLVAAFSQDA